MHFNGGGGTNQDYIKALYYYEKACRKRKTDLTAKSMALLYAEGGHGIKQDFKKSIQYSVEATKLGDGDAAAELGFYFMYGKVGQKKNVRKAMQMYEESVYMDSAQG